MRSIKSLYSIIRLVLFISLAVLPNNDSKEIQGPPLDEYIGGPDRSVHRGAQSSWRWDSYSRREAEPDQAVTMPRGLRVFHLPRVKSGHSTDVLFDAMDFSLKATTALMVAPSYTSESVGSPSLKHWIRR